MAKFRCVCGETISTSGAIPNPNEWRCISDVDLEQFFGTDRMEQLYQEMVIFYRCPVSDHIWVFWDGIENEPSLYAPMPISGIE